MSEFISHECGIALVRLLKPLSYYQEKYGTPLWGFTKLFLLMEKQHNRGQEAAGVGVVGAVAIAVVAEHPAGDGEVGRAAETRRAGPRGTRSGRTHLNCGIGSGGIACDNSFLVIQSIPIASGPT